MCRACSLRHSAALRCTALGCPQPNAHLTSLPAPLFFLCRYAGDEEGRGGIYNFVTKRGICLGERSKISWTQVGGQESG
jgi:hypothetical protein